MFSLFLELFGIDFHGRVSEEGRRPLEECVNLAEITGPGPCYQDEFVSVSAARVMHPPLEHAYAYRFDHEHVSVVFSGDTAPSEALAEFARGAGTLVHEATFPPALAKSHSPVADAARIATLAGVSQLILSPLVPSVGVGDEEWTAAARNYFSGGIVVGRDLLEVPV
jgi:ribonuclease BN (tRNA processing enzyme)